MRHSEFGAKTNWKKNLIAKNNVGRVILIRPLADFGVFHLHLQRKNSVETKILNPGAVDEVKLPGVKSQELVHWGLQVWLPTRNWALIKIPVEYLKWASIFFPRDECRTAWTISSIPLDLSEGLLKVTLTAIFSHVNMVGLKANTKLTLNALHVLLEYMKCSVQHHVTYLSLDFKPLQSHLSLALHFFTPPLAPLHW